MESRLAEPIERGERVRYTDTVGFISPEHPVVPYTVSGEESPSTDVRRLLSEAAAEMGRDIAWTRLYLGDDAVDRHGSSVPDETVEALETYRVGLLDTVSTPAEAGHLAELRRKLELSLQVTPVSQLGWTSSPVSDRDDAETVFFHGSDDQRATVESVVDSAVHHAFDRDMDTVTVVTGGVQGGRDTPPFEEIALERLNGNHGEGLVSEESYLRDYDGYPEDELVFLTRSVRETMKTLLSKPGDLDVVVASPREASLLSALASEAVGGAGVTATSYVGDGLVLASGYAAPGGRREAGGAGTVALIRAGLLLLEHLGWWDVVEVVEESVEDALSRGYLTEDLVGQTRSGEAVSSKEFVSRVVEHLGDISGRENTAIASTTRMERREIKEYVAGLYNLVFEDTVRADELEVNQLRDPDDEADIYLPEVGLNFGYWRRWSTERRIEVLLHEFAHVENYDDGHSPEFYRRLVELTYIAEDWRTEVEALFDGPVDFDLLKRLIVESVHEETIEPEVESVEQRKAALQREFGLSDDRLS